jgi:hypothetical protein
MVELLCVGLKRSLASMLPWDIPWHDPSHAVFFLALYGALGVIGLGLIIAAVLTVANLKGKGPHH